MGKAENEIIRKIHDAMARGRHGKSSVRLGIGDDAALWSPTPGWETVLTCDWFLEGTHFLRDKHPADAVGWKCLARAVSDIAAMGGKPRCFLMSLAIPAGLTGKWLNAFLRGLRRASQEFGCELAGGDTTRRDEVLINLTVIGEIERGHALRRAGAKPGDGIYVSGTLGEAELGLHLLKRKRGMARAKNAALRKHLYPRPRLELGRWLVERKLATAMMDLSDGLSTDLARLCAASGVGAVVDVNSLPSTSLVPTAEATQLALHGGDDYELLFIVKGKNEKRIPETLQRLRLRRIGEITRERKILVRDGRGKTAPLLSGGWDPFR
jgi:thiamine-monophosphate kinase